MEQNQSEVRQQLSEVLLNIPKNEQALKDVNLTLSSLASMVTSIMNKLETRTTGSEPTPTQNIRDAHGSIPKSMGENQAPSRTARIGTSKTLPVDVVDDSSVRCEAEGPTKTYTRLTRSKDAKLKGVSVSEDNSEDGGKGRGGDKALKKARAPKGCAQKRSAVEAGIDPPKPTTNVSQEDGAVVVGDAEVGSGPGKIAAVGSGVEGCGEGGLQGGNKAGGTSGELNTAWGGGSLGGGTGHAHREESVGVEGGDVGVVAEVASIHASPVKGASTISVSKSPKTRSSGKEALPTRQVPLIPL